MRKIKFRGRTIVNFPDSKNNIVIPKGKWIHGGITYDEDRVWIDMPYYGQIIVDKKTVGQYTGLHDKNRKKIYEGDIISYKDRITDKEDVFIVKYCNERAGFILSNKTYDEMTINVKNQVIVAEVIGNVWDNPDLLNN